MTLTEFEPAHYDSPKMRSAALEQIEVRVDPALVGVEATAEIELADGKKLSARCKHPRGSPENPLSQAEIESKFRVYAKGHLPDRHIDETVKAVARLEDLASVRKLMEMLRAPSRSN